MSLCIRFKLVVEQSQVESESWKTFCDHKTLKRVIPDLNYVPSKWSMCKFSIKSYKTLIEFWDQLAQVLSNLQKNFMIVVWQGPKNVFGYP